jgi:hypothetical protein
LIKGSKTLRQFSGVVHVLVLPGFIPQGQLNPVPQSQLVIDEPQIILHYMFGRTEGIGNLPVLAPLGYALNDDTFAFARPSGVCCLSNHNCLL